jgi:hypothetical protein
VSHNQPDRYITHLLIFLLLMSQLVLQNQHIQLTCHKEVPDRCILDRSMPHFSQDSSRQGDLELQAQDSSEQGDSGLQVLESLKIGRASRETI